MSCVAYTTNSLLFSVGTALVISDLSFGNRSCSLCIVVANELLFLYVSYARLDLPQMVQENNQFRHSLCQILLGTQTSTNHGPLFLIHMVHKVVKEGEGARVGTCPPHLEETKTKC